MSRACDSETRRKDRPWRCAPKGCDYRHVALCPTCSTTQGHGVFIIELLPAPVILVRAVWNERQPVMLSLLHRTCRTYKGRTERLHIGHPCFPLPTENRGFLNQVRMQRADPCRSQQRAGLRTLIPIQR